MVRPGVETVNRSERTAPYRRPRRRGRWPLVFVLLAFLTLAVACRQEPVILPPVSATPHETPVAQSPLPEERAGSPGPLDEPSPTRTPAVLPTLYPTFTPAPGLATPTPTLAPTPTPGPTVDFSQVVVDFRLTIPEIGYDRRFEGTAGNHVTVVDETRGFAAMLENQAGVLVELQQALPELELEPLPDDCPTCAAFSFELPLRDLGDSGWLQDPIMLASIENYTALALGPHFPQGTVLGLRRSASPFDVAHTLALTEAGLLYRWLATEPRVEPPQRVDPALSDLLADLPDEPLAPAYTADCPGTPVETLLLNPDGDEFAQARRVRIQCPAFSLPSTLVPLYAELDRLLEQRLADQGLPQPPPAIPLTTMLDLQRPDSRLTVLYDGTVVALTTTITDSVPLTTTVTATNTLTTAAVISLTTALRDTGVLTPGVDAFAAAELPNILLVRSPEGMLEVAWEEDDPPQALRPLLEELEQLLQEVAGG